MNKRIYLLFVYMMMAVLFFMSCNNQKIKVRTRNPSIYLYKVKINDKWGFIDSFGNIKIKPQYNNVGEFNEGLAPVSIGGIKIIDTLNKIDGKLIGDYWNIVPIMKGEKWGYIDTCGKLVIKPSYDFGFEFNNNGTAVVLVDKLYGYIDTAGILVLPLKFNDAQPFYGEYAAVSDTASDSTYFIDITGEKKFVSPWDVTISFIDDFAPISVINENYDLDSVYYKNGYIDKKGNVIVKPIYHKLNLFHDGRALFGLKSGGTIKYGFLNEKGKEQIPAKYNFATDFGDSLAWVQNDCQLCIININGKILKTTRYENALFFSESVSAVWQNGKWGYCDKKGDIIIDLQFDEVKPFNNCLAWVRKGNVIGYINKKGKFIWSNMDL